MIPFNVPYTREVRQKIAAILKFKDEADFVRKRYNSVRTQIGLATPSYDATGPILNASVIRSVFPGFQEFKGDGNHGRTRLQKANSLRRFLGLQPFPNETYL